MSVLWGGIHCEFDPCLIKVVGMSQLNLPYFRSPNSSKIHGFLPKSFYILQKSVHGDLESTLSVASPRQRIACQKLNFQQKWFGESRTDVERDSNFFWSPKNAGFEEKDQKTSKALRRIQANLYLISSE